MLLVKGFHVYVVATAIFIQPCSGIALLLIYLSGTDHVIILFLLLVIYHIVHPAVVKLLYFSDSLFLNCPRHWYFRLLAICADFSPLRPAISSIE